MVRVSTLTRFLAPIPRPLLGIILAALALIEAFLLLRTSLILPDLLATGAEEKAERLWKNLTWDLGIAFIAISAIGGLIVYVFLKAFLHQNQMRSPATSSTT
jgi:hypothetical protein